MEKKACACANVVGISIRTAGTDLCSRWQNNFQWTEKFHQSNLGMLISQYATGRRKMTFFGFLFRQYSIMYLFVYRLCTLCKSYFR